MLPDDPGPHLHTALRDNINGLQSHSHGGVELAFFYNPIQPHKVTFTYIAIG